MYRQQNPMRGLSGGIFLIGLAIAFFVGHGLFLTIFFIALAFSSLFGAMSTLNPRGAYGGLHSFIWLAGIGILFLVGFWPWILVLCGLSAILGALFRPIMAGILGVGILGAASQPQQQPYYQPSQQPYQPYQQGYQAPPPAETYQEGGQVYQQQPPQEQQPQYEQPQVQYPQEMPPQQQQ